MLLYVTSRFERDPINQFAAAYDQEQAMNVLVDYSRTSGWIELCRDESSSQDLAVLDSLVDLGFAVERLTFFAGKESQSIERSGPHCRRESELAIARWSGECHVVNVSASSIREYRLSRVGVDVANAYRRSEQASSA